MTCAALPERAELASAAFFADPYPYYQRMRKHAEPLWLSHQQQTSSGGVLLFSRYHDALAIFRCAQGISKNLRSVRAPGTGSAFDLHLLHRDGADHLRLRRLVSSWFSVQAVERCRPLMRELATALLKPLADRGSVDLIAEFAEPLPLNIIASLIGVPQQDLAQIRAWSLLLGDGFDSLLADAAVLNLQKQAMTALLAYLGELIERRPQPDGSLLGFLLGPGAAPLDHDELIAMLGFLLFAGHETTVNLIGNAVWLLLSHPNQWAAVRQQPDLIPGAVEEVLRFESPEQRTSFRLVTEPLSINGHRLEAGQQIGVIIGSVNRDEAVFERAAEFNIRRSPNPHLAFGLGLHNCLGKTLARVEAQVALQVLCDALPAMVLLDQQPQWRKNSFFRGLSALRIGLTEGS